MTMCEGHKPEMNQVLYFGTIDVVLQDLKEDLRMNGQVQIAHVNDPGVLAQAKNAEQVIKLLLGQDLDKLPVYPKHMTGDGEYKSGPLAFYNRIQLCVRGETTSDEPKNLNILLPNGVRL